MKRMSNFILSDDVDVYDDDDENWDDEEFE